jgi:hypothetical protein
MKETSWKTRHRYEFDIKRNFTEKECEMVNGTNLTRTEIVVGCCENGNEHSASINCGSFMTG